MSEVIKKIHSAALMSTSLLLDEAVFVTGEVGVERFKGQCLGESFIDVPLATVGCLGHAHFSKSKSGSFSWKDAVYCLRGDSWGEEVIHYFESPLEDKKFPAENTNYELKLMSIGGLIVCTNGNHRLIAAKTWLVHKFGDRATLKRAKVNRYAMNESMKNLAMEAVEKKSSIAICRSTSSLDHLKIDGEKPEFFVRLGASDFYAVTGEVLCPINSVIGSVSLLARIFGGGKNLASLKWVEVPPLLLTKMLKTDWIPD